ncbi:MAG: nucleotidyltransferase domain-containing protein, partial [Deltaproteobacteria bacterium]|nr:nucleotidyltransferase domain-containing protein [Deltaproteobacteria bacterium]
MRNSQALTLEGLTMVEEKLAKSDRILEEMVSRLISAFNPDHIYLYGSRARGEAGPGSGQPRPGR